MSERMWVVAFWGSLALILALGVAGVRNWWRWLSRTEMTCPECGGTHFKDTTCADCGSKTWGIAA